MEDYEEFIQRKYSEIRKNDMETAGAEISRSSSNICFYGVPILAPQLNKEKKEEMQRVREAAASLRNKMKSSSQSRVSYIQSILDTVQVRKTPTFEEFKLETRDMTQSDALFQPGSENKRDETLENPSISPSAFSFPSSLQVPSEDVPIPAGRPLTSTACDGHTATNLRYITGATSLQNSHSTVLFEGLPLFSCADVNPDDGFGSEFVPHSDKHPHVDISQLGVSSGYVTRETSDVNSSCLEGGEETSRVITGTEGKHSDFGGFFLNSSMLTKANNIIRHTPVDGDILEEESAGSNQAQIDVVTGEGSLPLKLDPCEGPYHMSLQSLLKKSQEHRRRQRLLRNQTKVLKAGEGEQGDKLSLSDKENEEILPGEKTEIRKSREKKKDQLPESKMPCQDAQIHAQGITGTGEPDTHNDTDAPKCEVSNDRCLNATTSVSSTADARTRKDVPAPSNLEPNAPATSALSTTPTSTKSLYQSKGRKMGSMLPRPCLAASKKMNIPSPKFSLSPVRSLKSRTLSDPLRKPLINTVVCVDKNDMLSPRSPAKTKGPLDVNEFETSLCKSTDQCEQIAQLELKLSSLKILISDLESTLADSMTDKSTEAVTGDEGCLPYSDGKSPGLVTFGEAAWQESFGTWAASKQCDLPGCVASLAQNTRLPETFGFNESRQLSQRGAILADTSNHAEERRAISSGEKMGLENARDTPNGSLLNRSYDVDSPSALWGQTGPAWMHPSPELEGRDGVFRAKRRLLMNGFEENVSGPKGGKAHSPSATSTTVSQRPVQELQQESDLQIRTQHRQQRELLQCLAAKYQYLQSVSFPCPGVSSRLEDTATSPSRFSLSDGLGPSSILSELTLAELSSLSNPLHVSQSCPRLPVCQRPLLAAVVKGFLTRRLLRTERVAQLVRTIKDTQLFLHGFQTQTPGRENISRQDRVLQERVSLQLRAARYELHDLFFSLSSADRMQLISWDRHLARERELKVKENKTQEKGRVCLSAATRKALERKRMVNDACVKLRQLDQAKMPLLRSILLQMRIQSNTEETCREKKADSSNGNRTDHGAKPTPSSKEERSNPQGPVKSEILLRDVSYFTPARHIAPRSACSTLLCFMALIVVSFLETFPTY